MHKLAILSVDINPGVEVDSSVPHVTRDAVAGLQQGCSGDGLCGHFHAFRIEQDVSTISQMEKISGHEHSNRLGGSASHLSGAEKPFGGSVLPL
jgi:hypothetical protein